MISLKKIITSLFIFLSVISFGIFDVKADNIDANHPSSLTVTYQYGSEKLNNADISVYFLANLDSQSGYYFRDEYQSIAFDPTGMTTSELSLKAEEIETFIGDNQLQPGYLQQTYQNGVTKFSNLVPGIYLVIVDTVDVGSYRYSASPTLLSIPNLEDGTYQYDVQMNVKTEQDEIGQEVTPPGDNTGDGQTDTEVPNTIDNIVIYVILLVLSLLVILGVGYYIIKKKGEKEENENKK